MGEMQKTSAPNCLRCDLELKKIMNMPIRTGGVTGFFANFGEMSEQILTLEVFRCPSCRKLEFFDLDESLPNS